jgi:hypothetical protein
MLSTRLGQCTDCSTIDSLLEKIDCVLAKNAQDQLNNNKYELGKCIPVEVIDKLIRYKDILLKRRFNPYYAYKIPNTDIISRVNTLLN